MPSQCSSVDAVCMLWTGRTVNGRRSRGSVDRVVLYACIGGACLVSIVLAAVVVTCRRRSHQAAAAAAASQRLQPPSNKLRLSAFDAYVGHYCVVRTTGRSPFVTTSERVCLSACSSVCLSAGASPEPHVPSSPNFLCLLFMGVPRGSVHRWRIRI